MILELSCGPTQSQYPIFRLQYKNNDMSTCSWAQPEFDQAVQAERAHARGMYAKLRSPMRLNPKPSHWTGDKHRMPEPFYLTGLGRTNSTPPPFVVYARPRTRSSAETPSACVSFRFCFLVARHSIVFPIYKSFVPLVLPHVH